MQTTEFEKKLKEILEDPINNTPDTFYLIKQAIQPLSTPFIMYLINQAVSLMGKDEIYLEAGTAQGGSLVGALIENPDVVAISVDNWSQNFNWPDPEQATKVVWDNIDRFEIGNNIWLAKYDTEEFFLSGIEKNTKIGVFFYDADHSEEVTFNSIKLSLPFLSENALIFIDDASIVTVSKAIDSILKSFKLQVIYRADVIETSDPVLWNGLAIIKLTA